LKLELLQHTGSFKARGALNALSLADGQLEAGVIAASGGNHGLAVAWAAGQVGCAATIFVPTTAPATKVAGLRALGADVRLVG
jgi:threonine dehydratase